MHGFYLPSIKSLEIVTHSLDGPSSMLRSNGDTICTQWKHLNTLLLYRE